MSSALDDVARGMAAMAVQDNSVPLYQALIVDKEDVLLLGESVDLSWTLALLAIRGGVDGVIASTKDPTVPWSTHDLRAKLLTQIDRSSETTLLKSLLAVLQENMSISQSYIQNLFLQADATKLDDFYSGDGGIASTKNIGFVCPYSKDSATGDLIHDTFKSASQIQETGDRLFIQRLDDTYIHADRYNWDSVLEESKRLGYQYNGIDSVLFAEISIRGYLHHTLKGTDYHHTFLDKHEIHVFVKIGDSKPKPYDLRYFTDPKVMAWLTHDDLQEKAIPRAKCHLGKSQAQIRMAQEVICRAIVFGSPQSEDGISFIRSKSARTLLRAMSDGPKTPAASWNAARIMAEALQSIDWEDFKRASPFEADLLRQAMRLFNRADRNRINASKSISDLIEDMSCRSPHAVAALTYKLALSACKRGAIDEALQLLEDSITEEGRG